jgi:hypothetical protein
MRLLRLSDVETSPNDRVFRYSRLHAIVVALAAVGGAGWLVFHAYTTGWKPGYYIGAVVLLFLELMRRFITARFRPSNWLVRMNDAGVFVQLRSYLNYHLPAGDLTVVFVDYSEIRSARLVKERVTTPDPRGRKETQYLRYVELELVGNVAPLTKAVQDELAERAPAEKRWYGSSSTLYGDHPVRMEAPPFLRVRWAVVPGARKFLHALPQYVPIADPVSLTHDFTHLQSLSREEQQKQLRELVERGQIVTAIYIARKLYGCGLAEAKQMVEAERSE